MMTVMAIAVAVAAAETTTTTTSNPEMYAHVFKSHSMPLMFTGLQAKGRAPRGKS
jgi:hypothetical protein